jgi:mono/diheme cytochrome c family protein
MATSPRCRWRSACFRLSVTALLLGLLGTPSTWAQAPSSRDLVAQGKYIFGAAGGCGCHTETGKPVNSGGRKYDGPFGSVYSSNITPDRQTGIGGWTDDQIITAIRLGRRPNGERLIPVHPYTVFNGMAAEDLRALVAFLRSLPAVNRQKTPKQITMPLFESVFLPTWLAAFAPRETPPPTAPTSGLARGEYLVRAVGHCGECHTPRGVTYATDNSRFLGGTSKGPEGDPVPNITPDKDTGLTWSEDQIAEFLESGLKPDGDGAQGLMDEVINGTGPVGGYKVLIKADRLAIARYLKTVPAVRNKVPK